MKSLPLFLVLLCVNVSFQISCFAKNIEFHQQQIPTTIVLEETGDVLTLRGAALHKKYFKDSYLGAYYSLNNEITPQAAINDRGPKRMWLYFLTSVDNLREYWEDGIEANNSPDVVAREQISISQFFKMIDMPLRDGDTLILDFVPNVGTKVIIKGSMKGLIKGNEFYNLVLKTWMGRSPPSEKFRKDLFNLS